MGLGKSTVTNDGNDRHDGEITITVWLDVEINDTIENQKAQQKLHAIVKLLKVFNDTNECEKYIRSLSSSQRVSLIVNTQQGRQIVPRIHSLRQLGSIYIYGKDKKDSEQWIDKFPKIKIVDNQLSSLITRIKSDQENCQLVDEVNPSKTHLTPQFAYSQLLSDVLLQIESSENDKKNFFSLCKEIYKYNDIELNNIHEFEQKYTSDKALRWYPRLTFIDTILNRALGTQDIDTIFLFQFFIHDLHQQIIKHQCQYPVKAYRGQLVTNDTITSLQQSVGRLISIDTFFSTAVNRNLALSFLSTSDNLNRVLFEIGADPKVRRTKPFADIIKHGYFSEEDEVLFAIGSVFRITDVRQDDDQIWNIQMTLCGDEDHDTKPLFNEMPKKYGYCDGEGALFAFSRVLRAMGKFDEAEKYCHRLLHHFYSDEVLLDIVYDEFYDIAVDKNDHKFNMRLDKKSYISDEASNSYDGFEPIPKATMIDRQISENNSRYVDVINEKHNILLPIEGHEQMPLVSLEEAVEPLISILPDIRRKVHTAKLNCKNPADGLTSDESAAIMLYTMEWEPQHECLYFVLNACLRTADRRKLKPWFLYLKLILTALSRLPSVHRTVYRGIRLDLSSEHEEGDQFFWWGFSSCTTTINALKSDQFLGDSGTRTLFHIECMNGKDIGRHSYFQKEEEILLLPATYLEVKSCFEMAPGLHVIQLTEIKPKFPYLEPV